MRAFPEFTDDDIEKTIDLLDATGSLNAAAKSILEDKELARSTAEKKLFNRGIRVKTVLVGVSDEGRETLARIEQKRKARKVQAA